VIQACLVSGGVQPRLELTVSQLFMTFEELFWKDFRLNLTSSGVRIWKTNSRSPVS